MKTRLQERRVRNRVQVMRVMPKKPVGDNLILCLPLRMQGEIVRGEPRLDLSVYMCVGYAQGLAMRQFGRHLPSCLSPVTHPPSRRLVLLAPLILCPMCTLTSLPSVSLFFLPSSGWHGRAEEESDQRAGMEERQQATRGGRK